jgi:protease-4
MFLKISLYEKMPRSLLRGYFISIIFISLIVPSPLMAAGNPFYVPERGSASYSDGPFGATLNPVFADLPSTPLLAYQYMFYDGKKMGSHFTQAGMFGLTLLYGRFQDIYSDRMQKIDHAGADYYRITKGFFIKNIAGIGASWSFSHSHVRPYKGYRGLDVSLLLRPWRYISLGFVLDDAWGEINGNRIRWREIYSLSIRPYLERVTLSLDVIHKRGGRASKIDVKATADVRLWYDISIFATLDRKLNLLFGLSIPLHLRSFSAWGVNLHYYRSSKRKSAPDQNSFGIGIPLFKDEDALSIPFRPNYLTVTLDGPIKEIEMRSFFGAEPFVFYDLVRCLKRASADPAVDGIIVKINKVRVGFPQVQELRRELKMARSAGKKVYAIMKEPGNMEYYLASACDKIYFTPNSTFYITGLTAQVYFFKGLMDKVGVRFESIKRGVYKSFDEPFTREHMSREFRENMMSLVKNLNDQYLNDIMADRGISPDVIEVLFNKGQLTPEEAVQSRFVDKIGYHDEALEDISGNMNVESVTDYLKKKIKEYSWGPAPKIAIVYIDGSIVSGKTFKTGWFRSIGDEKFQTILEKSFKDPLVRAVVIRVNSGGGSASASDYMWNAIVKMKKKHNKPVVFSFGNIAASGGYYVACAADKIFTNGGSITGSIGVVFGKITLKELYEKLGINKDVVKMSEFADIFSESRHLSEKEKLLIQSSVDFSYNRFTGKVIEGRNIKAEEISRLAEGRVFSGLQACDSRLTDEIGGLVSAVEYAKLAAKVDGNIEIVKYPDDRGPLLELFELPDIQILSEHIGGVIKNLEYIQLKNEKSLYLFPYQIEIQ